MVKPAARREAIALMCQTYGVSERRACDVVALGRSTCRYEARKDRDDALRNALKKHAAARKRWGYRRLMVLVKRDGFRDNHKRIYRVYREEGLQVRRRKRKRTVAVCRQPLASPAHPNEVWSMDFMQDSLYDGRRFRILNVVDDYTRECLSCEVDTSLNGLRVSRVLERLIEERGQPQAIRTDNGPEFTGKHLDDWAYQRQILLDPIEPGKPMQNAYIESFNGKFRDECLNENWFIGLEDARKIIAAHRQDYNEVRPHSALDDLTPNEFARRAARHPPRGMGRTVDEQQKVMLSIPVGKLSSSLD